MIARESLPLHPAFAPRLASRSLSFALSPQLAPFPFNHFCTLSFSVSQLSRGLPAGCALFGKKPGVHPLDRPLSPPFPGTPCSRIATLAARLAFIGGWPLSITPFTRSPAPREKLRGIADAFPLTPFPTSLTQKQGGRGYWSYQLSSQLDAIPSLRPALCVLRVSAVSLLLFPFVPLAAPPCPSPSFPLQWKYPFPVITGENQ